MTKLPINLNDLLRQRTVEGDRIEYKAGWNPDPIIRTVCAFANDFENLGGGYVVIGQDCDANGQPVFPPVGLTDNQFDKIQRELLAHCQLIQPPCFPVLSLEEVEGRKLIVLWAPGGQTRPYKAPEAVTAKHKAWKYFIRRYSSTVAANGSPAPLFETDDDRLSFVIRLPRHPLSLVPTVDGGEVTPQVTAQVTAQVGALLEQMNGEMTRQAMQDAVGLAHREHFRKAYLTPALEQGVIEMTLPDKPNSRSQRYRLTALGKHWRDIACPVERIGRGGPA